MGGMSDGTLSMAAVQVGLAAEDDARLELGKTVFLERATPACGLCHTLADAGATGEIGPILDTMKPGCAVVHRAVTQGVGPMKPYGDHLSEAEIDALAYYVSTITDGVQ
jgi:cytochrome c6